MDAEECLTTLTTKQVLSAALELPDDDRVELIEALIASVQPADQSPLMIPGAK